MTQNQKLVQNDILIQALEKTENLHKLSSALYDALEDSPKSPTVANIKKQIISTIVELRLSNWKAQQLINSTKEITSKTKQEADVILLDIQNIYYQHKHLNREIEKCENFLSKHEQLDLIPLDQFLEENPRLKEQYDSDPTSRDINHTITLERLKDEEKRRLELFVRKTELQETRTKLSNEIKSLRDDLEDVKGYESMFKKLTTETESMKKVFHKH